jgi:hypothetical protein
VKGTPCSGGGIRLPLSSKFIADKSVISAGHADYSYW